MISIEPNRELKCNGEVEGIVTDLLIALNHFKTFVTPSILLYIICVQYTSTTWP